VSYPLASSQLPDSGEYSYQPAYWNNPSVWNRAAAELCSAPADEHYALFPTGGRGTQKFVISKKMMAAM